jgi:hypothetical protein
VVVVVVVVVVVMVVVVCPSIHAVVSHVSLLVEEDRLLSRERTGGIYSPASSAAQHEGPPASPCHAR